MLIRKIRIIMLIVFLLPFTALVCHGEAVTEQNEELYDMSGAQDIYDSLDDETKSLLHDAGIDSASITSESTADSLLLAAQELLSEKLTGPLKAFVLLFSIIVICRLCGCFENKSIGETAGLVGTLACAGVMLPFFTGLIGTIETLVTTVSVFLLASVPVYSGLMIACGKASTAVSHGTLTLAVGNLIPVVAKGLILPAVNILLAFAIVSTVSTLSLDKLSDGIYRFIKWLLILVVTVFFALIATQTAINASIDEATAKTAKLVVSSAIPVVGGALGDSLAAIQGGVQIVKSGVGAFGILAAIFIILPVLIEICLWIIICWAGQIAADLFDSSGIAKFLSTGMSVFKMLLAVVVSIGAICVVCASIVILAGGSL